MTDHSIDIIMYLYNVKYCWKWVRFSPELKSCILDVFNNVIQMHGLCIPSGPGNDSFHYTWKEKNCISMLGSTLHILVVATSDKHQTSFSEPIYSSALPSWGTAFVFILQWLKDKRQNTTRCTILFLTLTQNKLQCTFHDLITIANVVSELFGCYFTKCTVLKWKGKKKRKCTDQWKVQTSVSERLHRQLRARRALSLFNDVPLRTRK